MSDRELILKLERARIWVNNHQRFYAGLLGNLRDKLVEIPTACTNGVLIKWGRKFLASLDREETRYVLLHEALHCAHGDLWMLPHDRLANIAADYVLEFIMRNIPGIRQPKIGLRCPREFTGMPATQIYKILLARQTAKPKNPKPPKGKQDEQDGAGDEQDGAGDEQDEQDGAGDEQDEQDGAGDEQDEQDGAGDEQDEQDGAGDEQDEQDEQGIGDFEAPAKIDPRDGSINPLREQWERVTIQAAIAASATRGNIPADMQAEIERLKRPSALNWRAEVSAFLKNTISTRAEWSRPARRHAMAPVIYPSRKVTHSRIVLVRDTSGSIDLAAAALMTSEMNHAIASLGCPALAIDCDMSIHAELRLPEQAPTIPHVIAGRGGTDFRPVFARVAELLAQGEKLAGVVYLTDLDGEFPTNWTEPIPTLWIVTGYGRADKRAPFGRSVPFPAD